MASSGMTQTVASGTPKLISSGVYGFNRTASNAEDSAARVFSGQRILRSGDDAASLTVSTRLKIQMADLRQSARNAAQANSFSEIAKEGLAAIRATLSEASAVAKQATVSTSTRRDRILLQQQLRERLLEIDRIVDRTRFENRTVLDGSFSNISVRVGGEEDTIDVSVARSDRQALFGEEPLNVTDADDAAAAKTRIDNALQTIGNRIGALDGAKQRLFSAQETIGDVIRGVEQASTNLTQVDLDEELRELADNRRLLDISSAVIAQAQRLSSELLTILEFRIPEITRQSDSTEAKDKPEEPTPSGNSDADNPAPSA